MMKGFGFLTALLALATSVSSIGGDVASAWVPTLRDIHELELKVRMPKGTAPLNTIKISRPLRRLRFRMI